MSAGVLEVLVVGQDPLTRSGLAAMLARDGRLHVAAELAEKDVETRARSLSSEGEVVLWDLGPGDADRRGIERLRDRALDLPLAVLLPSDQHALEAFALGARGLLLRDGDPARLGAMLAAVAAGGVVLDEALAEHVLRPRPPAAAEVLTPREAEVVELLARGLSNRQIAEALGVSEHTAKFHVNAILTKLGAETRTEAVVLAAKLGLVVL